MLYDAKTETILYDRFLWKNPVATNEAIITRTETETYVEETLKDRMDHISLGASIEFTMMKFLTVSITQLPSKYIRNPNPKFKIGFECSTLYTGYRNIH